MSAAAQPFDPFKPPMIPFHVRGESVTDIGSVIKIDYVTTAPNWMEAMEKAQKSGLCRIVVHPIKEGV